MADPTTPTPSITMSEKWQKGLKPLVEVVGCTLDELTAAFAKADLIGAEADDVAFDTIINPKYVKDEAIIAALPVKPKRGMPAVMQAMDQIRSAAAPPAPAPAPAPAGASPGPGMGMMGGSFVIPEVASGTKLLQTLSASPKLPVGVNETTIAVALEAFFMYANGMNRVPEKIAKLMEDFAERAGESVSEDFMELLTFISERRWADFGINKRYVTTERKNKVMGNLSRLPAAVYQFHQVLAGWNELVDAAVRRDPWGRRNIAYPPVSAVIAAADGVIACLKDTFAGFGLEVTKYLAYEGAKIQEVTENPKLPGMTGFPNRESMLREVLGRDVTDADSATQRGVASYIAFVAKLKTGLPVGQEGPALEALYNLGQQILPWMQQSMMPLDGNPSSSRRGKSSATGIGERLYERSADPMAIPGGGSRSVLDYEPNDGKRGGGR